MGMTKKVKQDKRTFSL